MILRAVRFTISKLLFATVVIAAFLGLRSYILNYDMHDGTSDLDRIGWANMVMVAMVSAFTAASHGRDARPHPLILHSAIAGAATAGLCSVTWGLEAFWYYLTHYSANRYIFALFIFRHVIGGGVLGSIVGFIWGVAMHNAKA